MRARGVVFVVGLLFSQVSAAGAQHKAPAPSQAPGGPGIPSKEFLIEGTGGGFDITVSASYVTVMRFPEPVGDVLNSNKKAFDAYVMNDSVALRPKAGTEKGAKANIAIETKRFKINVIVTVGDDADSVSQVIFTPAAEKAAFDARVAEEVARQVAPLREEYERKTRQAEQLINDKAEQEIALRMVRRFAVREVAAVERTDDNQIIRVSRAVTIGDDVYVYFTVQNRDAAAYALKAVRVTQSGGEIPARVVIENPSGKDAGALVGTVPPGRTSAGLVIIPMAKLAPGRAVQVEWVQGGRGKSVALTFRID